MKNIFWVLIFASIAAMIGCKAVNDVSTATTATLSGRINLMTAYVTPALPFGGTTVSIVGTNFTAVTDSAGDFEIMKLPQGTYDISLSHPGYGTELLTAVSIPGGGNAPFVIPDQQLWLIPLTTLSIDSVTYSSASGGNIVINGAFNNSPSWQACEDYFVMFCSNSPDVSSEPGKYEDFIYSGTSFEVNSAGTVVPLNSKISLAALSSEISFDALINDGVSLTDTLYFRIYGAPYYGGDPHYNANYYDKYTHQYVPPGLLPTGSQVFALKLQ